MGKIKFVERLTSAKIWLVKLITGNRSRPKIPRKKVQLQFNKTHAQFEEQVRFLEQRLSRPGLSDSAQSLGQTLLQDVQRFQELQIISVNEYRLETLPQPLLHPTDFSMWTLYQMYYYTETIFHYLKTCESVEL